MVEISKLSLSYETFEYFWENYPKKINKNICFKEFFKIDDPKNFWLWFQSYIEKRKIEETPKKRVINPLNFIREKRYYDEIIIDESKKDKYKLIAKAIKEDEEEEKLKREAEEKRKEIIRFYNSLTEKQQEDIKKEADEIIQKQNPILFEKKGLFYEKYKKIIIRSILNKFIW